MCKVKKYLLKWKYNTRNIWNLPWSAWYCWVWTTTIFHKFHFTFPHSGLNCSFVLTAEVGWQFIGQSLTCAADACCWEIPSHWFVQWGHQYANWFPLSDVFAYVYPYNHQSLQDAQYTLHYGEYNQETHAYSITN